MRDFFATKHGLTIEEITVTLTGARVRPGAPPSARIDDGCAA